MWSWLASEPECAPPQLWRHPTGSAGCRGWMGGQDVKDGRRLNLHPEHTQLVPMERYEADGTMRDAGADVYLGAHRSIRSSDVGF